MSGAAPLVIVGGYGLVGSQAAELLRARNPGVPLVLAGRQPQTGRALAARLGATVARIDAAAREPLAELPERPAAVLAAVSDPGDRLLVDAMRRGIPIADINRGGPSSVLDVAVRAAGERAETPVLLSGSWMSGLTALAAACAAREVGHPERLEITVLVSSGDRVGPDAWGFSSRLAWPYHVMSAGRRRVAHPLTDRRRVRCPDGEERAAVRVGTLEQVTLPLTLGVATVETRLATHEQAAVWGLMVLKRTGALRALERPALRRLRGALLNRSGPGDFAGLAVAAHGGGRSAYVEMLDARGQSHLSAVGATLAAERVLGVGGVALPPGLSFPEQFAMPDADLAALRQAGVVVRAPLPLGNHGVARSSPAGELAVLASQILDEKVTA